MAAVCGAIAFCCVVMAIDAGGDYPSAPQGPGLTLDEWFNVQQGVRLAVGGKLWLLGAIDRKELFGDEKQLGPNPPFGYHLPDHPPLGRFWLGLFHQLALMVAPPVDHEAPFVTSAARVGSAAAFAATVFLVSFFASRWWGLPAGVASAASLVAMPRVFGHAHLASLETTTGLAYAAAVLSVAELWYGEAPPRNRTAFWTGLTLGAALLTKIQAIFLPPVVGVWALARWRARGVKPLAVWGVAGLAMLFLFWPWLWFDPFDHFSKYLGRTTARVSLHAYYLGTVFPDKDVPWHYPWILFAATLPAATLLLGSCGLAIGRRDAAPSPPTASALLRFSRWAVSREALLALAVFLPLVVFSIPGIAVYDGERLFLVSYPIWAVLCGRGAAGIVAACARWGRTPAAGRRIQAAVAFGIVASLLASLGQLIRIAPCYLSGYSLVVGGLNGADRLGLERTYWGDSFTRQFLQQTVAATPRGATVHLAPVLEAFQLREMITQSPVLRHHELVLEEFEEGVAVEYLMLFQRRADLSEAVLELLKTATPLATVERDGVVLAGLYRVARPAPANFGQ